MANLNVPTEFYTAFEIVISLPLEKFNTIIESVEDFQKDFTEDEVIAKVSEETEIPETDIDEVFRLIVNLIALKEIRGFDDSVLIKEIEEALIEKKIKPDDKFRKKINGILANKRSSFYSKAKSYLVGSENSKNFINSRIFSDLRPIFSDEVNDDFLGTVILHNLKIEYRQRDQTKEVHVTLNSDDLTSLKEQISRAEKKEKVIRKEMIDKSIQIFNLNN